MDKVDSPGGCLASVRSWLGTACVVLAIFSISAYTWTSATLKVPKIIERSDNFPANNMNMAIYRNQSMVSGPTHTEPQEPPTISSTPLPPYLQRIARIEKVCSTFEESSKAKSQANQSSHLKKKPPPRFLVNRKHQVFYCQVSKVACTTWTALVTDPNLGYQQVAHVHNATRRAQANITLTANYRAAEYDGFTRFLVVRHPLDRVLSAYYNIVNRRGKYGPGPKAVNAVLSLYNVGGVKNLTLSQFVDFLIESNDAKVSRKVLYDRHWDTYAHACNLCSVRYDYVIYFEDMSSDSKPVLQALGWPLDHLLRKNIINPGFNEPEKDSSNPWSVYLAEYKSISRQQLEGLLARYEEDMKLFGYTFDPDTLRTGFIWNTT